MGDGGGGKNGVCEGVVVNGGGGWYGEGWEMGWWSGWDRWRGGEMVKV